MLYIKAKKGEFAKYFYCVEKIVTTQDAKSFLNPQKILDFGTYYNSSGNINMEFPVKMGSI